jgi:hypothetical protein
MAFDPKRTTFVKGEWRRSVHRELQGAAVPTC